MSVRKRYKFNPETLAYESINVSLRSRILKGAATFAASIVIFGAIMYLSVQKFGLESPRTSMLRVELYEWHSKLYLLAQNIETNNSILNELQLRDNVVYRPVFGMEEISSDIRNAGFGGTDKYQHIKNSDYSGLLTSTTMGLDILTKKTYIQSKSYDDIELYSKRAGEMANCVPRISPIALHGKTRLSDRYGTRKDPFNGTYTHHAGIDLAGTIKDPIYATGDGTVIKVGWDRFGYGNFVLIDHGFGYKTRYAHLNKSTVEVGQTVKRGEMIGELGNSGRSTGPHLHYEVIYMNKTVDPLKYFNRNIKLEDYYAMVKNSGYDGKS